jgi:hypothetical protein
MYCKYKISYFISLNFEIIIIFAYFVHNTKKNNCSY